METKCFTNWSVEDFTKAAEYLADAKRYYRNNSPRPADDPNLDDFEHYMQCLQNQLVALQKEVIDREKKSKEPVTNRRYQSFSTPDGKVCSSYQKWEDGNGLHRILHVENSNTCMAFTIHDCDWGTANEILRQYGMSEDENSNEPKDADVVEEEILEQKQDLFDLAKYAIDNLFVIYNNTSVEVNYEDYSMLRELKDQLTGLDKVIHS